MTEEIEELQERLRRMIESESNRNASLRGATAWHRPSEGFRSDCLAWRDAEGGRELLMYNNALCDPIYVAFEAATDGGSMSMKEKAIQYVQGLLDAVASRLGVDPESASYSDLREELITAYQQGWVDREMKAR